MYFSCHSFLLSRELGNSKHSKTFTLPRGLLTPAPFFWLYPPLRIFYKVTKDFGEVTKVLGEPCPLRSNLFPKADVCFS